MVLVTCQKKLGRSISFLLKFFFSFFFFVEKGVGTKSVREIFFLMQHNTFT